MNVSERALLLRVNRRLAHDGIRMWKARAFDMVVNYGPFYTTDGNRIMQDWGLDLEVFARDLGVLGPGETLMDV